MARERFVFFIHLQSLLNPSFPKVSLAVVLLYLNCFVYWIQEAEAKQSEALPNLVGQKSEVGNWEFIDSAQITFDSSRRPITSPTSTDEQIAISELILEAKHLYEAGHFLLAAKTWQQALRESRSQGDTLYEALSWSSLALAYQQMSQHQNASAAQARSSKLVDKVKALPQNSQVIAQILNNRGSFQLASGQTEQALSDWSKAAQLYKQAGNRLGETWSLLNSSQALQTLGFYRRAVESLKSVNQQLKSIPNSPLKVIAMRSLGNALRGSGDLVRSREVLQRSLILAREIGLQAEIDATLISLGNTARIQKDKTAAWEFYKQAAESTGFVAIQAKLNQLSLLVEYKATDAAANLATVLAPEISALPAKRSSIYAKINFAQSLKKLQTLTKDIPSQIETVQLLANALTQAKSLEDPTAQAYTLGCLGSLYEQNQQWNEAKKLTQQALLLAQTMRSPDIDYRFSWQLGRILKAQGDTTGAITSYTQSTNALKSLRGDLVAVNPNIQFNFRDEVEPVYRQLTDLLLLSKQPSQENLIQARNAIEALQVAELNNFFQTACLDSKPIQVDTAIDQNDPKAAVIYPIILPDRLEVIVKLPGLPLQNYKVYISQTKLEKLLQELRKNLTRAYALQDVHLLSKQIYNWLIEPITTSLTKSKIETLVFVLDGDLRNIPMAALYDGRHYLVEKYAIALSPGLQILPPQPIKKVKMKALSAGLTEARQGFSALANVAVELEQVKSEVSSTVLLNRDFTALALQTELKEKEFSIVHLATHGQFSSEAAKTYILAWDKPIFVKDLDVLLRSVEPSRSAIELLVLSACETAVGDNRAVLGLAGVAHKAGARSTIASLWSLSDEGSTVLMGEFYRELTGNRLNKAQALRMAQLSMLQNPDYQHPMTWSGYILLGNWL